jgi:hypothetical protein
MGVATTDLVLLHGRAGVLTTWRDNRVQVMPIDKLEPRMDSWSQALAHVHRITAT